MPNCRLIPPEGTKRLLGDQREIIPGLKLTEDQLFEMKMAGSEGDAKAMGLVIAGELDSFATGAAARGHKGLLELINKMTEMFQGSDLNRGHMGEVKTLQAQSDDAAVALRKIVAEADGTNEGGYEALINFASHISHDMQAMPATNLAIQALVEGFFHSSRKLGQLIDAGQADVFTQARWIIETETFASLEGARNGIKRAAGRLLFSFRQDVPRARLAELVEELYSSAQKASDVPVLEGGALDQWRKARVGTGVIDETAPGSHPPGTQPTPKGTTDNASTKIGRAHV